VRFMRVYDWL